MTNTHFLPTGDYLRQLIGQSRINSTELKGLTRKRGIFTPTNDKHIHGSFLIKTGLSPFEFSELKESYKEKEDNPKSKTRSIVWSSENTLSDALPNEIDFNGLLNDQFGVVHLVSVPQFVAEDNDPNHISLDFELSRNDLTKNWGENVTYHKGKVEFKKLGSGNVDVSLSLTHTAPETKEFANKVADNVVSHFKSSGNIAANEKMKAIKFYDFTNEGRIAFLNELTQKFPNSILTFIDTKDIHFAPDETKSNPPEELLWMRDKIEDMKLKGKDLHSTFFVQDKSFHKYIQLFGLVCEYQHGNESYSGTCKIQYEFSEGNKITNDSELTLNITVINLAVNNISISKNKAKKEILDSLDSFKMECYEQHKKEP